MATQVFRRIGMGSDPHFATSDTGPNRSTMAEKFGAIPLPIQAPLKGHEILQPVGWVAIIPSRDRIKYI